jgi:phosphoglycerol transferase MdoB-like AlkP superfamily enzyme
MPFLQNVFIIRDLFAPMNSIFQRIRVGRFGLLTLLWVLLISISTITRSALFVRSLPGLDISFFEAARLYAVGFLFDAVNAVYFSAPLGIWLWLIPDRFYQRPIHRYILYGWFFIMSFILLFNAVAEWLFWDEFNVRFNFIAVDYLVYTTEVIGNIQQSYPLYWIIVGIAFTSVAIVVGVKSWIDLATARMSFRKRSLYLTLYTTVFAVSLGLLSGKDHRFSNNAYVNELAGNGMYDLFAAYRNNELDYEQFYRVMDNRHALSMVHRFIKTNDASFLSDDSLAVTRRISHPGKEKKLNVILISVESFSADFMKLFGNTEGVTPFLDSLAKESMTFTNLYATGTRTVRGLEALSLCVPPTPGQSIVRRPNNEHLFSMGKVFSDKGYSCEYIYGGYSYFDNMGYFFDHNSYSVVDRTAIDSKEIDYENIWGVADEDLFDLALRELDMKSKKAPVFAHIMTTSNHRPFTYPDGRIDIPSHTGRNGAVKYTDYAIGRFIKQASRKPWFTNTIFVIVADHCASSAGKTDLPIKRYHIPMLIFSPGNIRPGIINRLMSQIDIGPTLLGLLNFSYTSNFYGYDIFSLEPGRERAFISTYQNLGYMRDHKLVILSPQQKVSAFRFSDDSEQLTPLSDPALVDEAIAWYQSASFSFKHGLMK